MIAEPLEVRIIPAREESLARINDLIVRSRSYWNWPADYLKRARPLHEIEPSSLRHNRCFELLNMNDELAAFLAVWASPGFVDTPNRTKSAIGVSHGEEAAAAIVLAGVQGGSDQGGAGEREECQHRGA